MNNAHRLWFVAGASVLAMTSAAQAQDLQQTPQAQSVQQDSTGVMPDNAEDASTDAGEIIVTARRREESLQDVPTTINVATGNTLEKLNIQRFEDVQAIVPGLNLSSGTNGYTTAATIRGASFSVESGASPTVEFYLNEALIQSSFLFQSMFDVGQVEVLRGPQGTLRGRASPSGSITVATRRPDLREIGGYLNMTGTTEGGINANGAFNLPILADVLGLRVGAIVDESEHDQVRSINDGRSPYQRSVGGRASLRFEPTNWITANLMYQHQEKRLRSFDAVESFSVVNPDAPVVQPVIRAEDRLGIMEGARDSVQKQDLVTGQVDIRFAGQRLSYVGSYSKQMLEAVAPLDVANVYPNFEFYQDSGIRSTQKTHEIRLASEDRLFDALDYTVGVFFNDFSTDSDIINRSIVGGGATPPLQATPIRREGEQKERAFFGNLTWHIGDRTELSGGVRHIIFEDEGTLVVSGAKLLDTSTKAKPTVYNLSLSHRLNDSFLVYANTGSSWRAGPFFAGVFRPLTPRLEKYIDLGDEKSKSYEIGFKSTLLDRRLRLNVAAFRQDFDNFIYRGVPVYYVDLVQRPGGAVERPNLFNFGSSVDTRVHGVDVDATFQMSRQFSLGAAFSYAKGKIKDGTIACTDLNRDGRPDLNPGSPTAQQIKDSAGGELVGECTVNDRTSFAPDWSLTAQSEYFAPLSPAVDAYVRGLLTYYPSNEQDPNNPYDDVEDYGLLNVYTGIRDPEGAWEVSLFAKNLTNTGVTLSRTNGLLSTPALGAARTGSYVGATYTRPREFGLNIRYAFGSR